MKIRTATPDDAQALLAIYAPYVLTTAISFEYAAPSVEDFRKRITKILTEYPYLVAEEDGAIVGYAYAVVFHGREAYRHSVETSIYVDSAHHGKGIGKALYAELEKILLKQNVYTLCAAIASPNGRIDEHLTDSSERFHEKLGFTLVGKHVDIGYKFGKWYTIIWMEKYIGEKLQNPPPFIPFPNIKD